MTAEAKAEDSDVVCPSLVSTSESEDMCMSELSDNKSLALSDLLFLAFFLAKSTAVAAALMQDGSDSESEETLDLILAVALLLGADFLVDDDLEEDSALLEEVDFFLGLAG